MELGIAKALDYMIQCGDIEEIINRYQIKGENNKNERFDSLTFINITLRGGIVLKLIQENG